MKPLIALAEDDDDLRALLSEALEREGWLVLALEDGFELADYLDFAAHGRPPSVVLTDLRMPGLNGLEAIERARARGLKCPVVVMTSWPDDRVKAHAAALGVKAVITKPVDFEELLSSLKSAA
jgi:CheY-like chemotaxis protein